MTTRVRSEDAPAYGADLSDEYILARAQEILLQRMITGSVLANPNDAKLYCSAQLAGEERKVFAVLWLTTRHSVLCFEKLFFGTLTGAEVHAREVVKAALRVNAAACIICQNHPSGVVEPSSADRFLTSQLKEALNLVEVRLLDHLIVGPGAQAYSFAERGIL